MSAYMIIQGEIADISILSSGEEGSQVFSATVSVRSKRYDYVSRKRVADMFAVTCTGKIARNLHEQQGSTDDEGIFQEGSEVCVMTEVSLYSKGPVFMAREMRLIGHEGFEAHFMCGAVEKGSYGEIHRDDREDGHWANAQLRVPKRKYNDPDQEVNINYRIGAWDRKAKTLGENVIPEKDDKETDRRWIFIVGNTKTEKNQYTTDEGEEVTTYRDKTEVRNLEFTKCKTAPHSYGESIASGGSSGTVAAEDIAAIAAAAATVDADDIEDEDIPF